MDFYSSISTYYDRIFPYNPDQFAFIRDILPPAPDKALILDIGCATGDLPIALAKTGCRVFAIDNDPAMIALAREKKKGLFEGDYPVFEQMDMRTISQRFAFDFFDTVACFGNTLAHLTDPDDIYSVITGARGILKKGGVLTIQILNYNMILDRRLASLPLIENEVLTFERSYEFPDTGLIDFVTRLTLKPGNSTMTNRIPLYPLRLNELDAFLWKAGFKEIEFFGGFRKEPLAKESLPLVVRARA